MTTAASRPGGKFGGKFSGRGKTALPSNTATSASNAGTSATAARGTTTTGARPNAKNLLAVSKAATSANNANDDGTSQKENEVTMEMIHLKRSKMKRHEVFDKLNDAEEIVLDILNIAQETTKGLEYLANPNRKENDDEVNDKDEGGANNNDNTSNSIDAKSSGPTATNNTTANTQNNAKVDGDGDVEMKEKGDESKKDDDECNHETKEERWKKKIRNNGKSFMEKLKQIHDLLTPHKELVVNYGRIQNSSNNDETTDKSTDKTKSTDASSVTGTETEKKQNDDTEETNTKTKKNSMYASRLEMRLAIDKKKLLNDLVVLEKKMLQEEINDLKSTFCKTNETASVTSTSMTKEESASNHDFVGTSGMSTTGDTSTFDKDNDALKRKREE